MSVGVGGRVGDVSIRYGRIFDLLFSVKRTVNERCLHQSIIAKRLKEREMKKHGEKEMRKLPAGGKKITV